MNIAISAVRAPVSDPREDIAKAMPHRRGFADPLDPRLESPLGRMRAKGMISEPEYQAGVRWRNIYHNWLQSIGAPNPFPAALEGGRSGSQRPLHTHFDDEMCEKTAKYFKIGEQALKARGQRVFHAVSAIVVYEEPEELGDYDFTARAAKIGLAELVKAFGG